MTEDKRDSRGQIVGLIIGPGITTTNAVGRFVKFEDGTGEIQSYGVRNGWRPGGTDLKAMWASMGATKDNLHEMGYTEKEIEEILEFVPEEHRR